MTSTNLHLFDQHQEGDVVIDILAGRDWTEYKYCVGQYHRGLVEWVGKDLKTHRYQGLKVVFNWESALKLVRKLTGEL